VGAVFSSSLLDAAPPVPSEGKVKGTADLVGWGIGAGVGASVGSSVSAGMGSGIGAGVGKVVGMAEVVRWASVQQLGLASVQVSKWV
jgi:hypothetical protein